MRAVDEILRARARASLITRLLLMACRICGAAPTRGCDPEHPDGEMIQLNGEPGRLVIHADRAADAVTARLVSRETLVAQFGDGTVPAALTST